MATKKHVPEQTIVPLERISESILWLRGQKVMLSHDLAQLYGVAAKVLMQAVKRNAERFPEDFIFQLDKHEVANLKSQIVTSSWGGARRASPYAFTEQGVAMLSSVLRSQRAIQVNIEIMRAFVSLRQLLTTNAELARKLAALEPIRCPVQDRVRRDPRTHEAAGAREQAADRFRALGGMTAALP